MEPKQVLDVVDEWLPRICDISEQQNGVVVDGKCTRGKILGHMVGLAINNCRRFVVFKSGDLSNVASYSQEGWVKAGAYEPSSMVDLALLWTGLKRQIATLVEHVPAEAASYRWVDKTLTFGFLFDDYVVYVLHCLPEVTDDRALAAPNTPAHLLQPA